MQKSCYKMAGVSDVGMHIMIHANKKIIMIVLCPFVPLMFLNYEPLTAGVDPVLSLPVEYSRDNW